MLNVLSQHKLKSMACALEAVGNNVPRRHNAEMWRKTPAGRWRRKAKKTQEQAAEDLGYSDHTPISKMERGINPLSQDYVEYLADLNGVSRGTIWDREPK